MSAKTLRHLVLLAACVSTTAFGQELVVETLQGGRLVDWIIAAQRNPAYEGQAVQVVVRHNTPSRDLEVCGRYQIQLDPVTSKAFEIGPCDPQTNATLLRLLSRSPLFETQSGPVPRPREDIQVGAVVTFGGMETAGSRPEFESTTSCVIQERVFERNILHPEEAPFEYSPPAYRLIPLDPDVQVQPAQNGWLLSRPFVRGQPARGVPYEVQDAQGRVVLRDRMSKPLQCNEAEAHQEEAPPPVNPPPSEPPPSEPPPPPPPARRVLEPAPGFVFSLAGELHGLPSYSVEGGGYSIGGGAVGPAVAVSLELPPWILLSAKVSVGFGDAVLGVLSASAALSLHVSPETSVYLGPAGRLWGATYRDSSTEGAADLGVVLGIRHRFPVSPRADCVLFAEAMGAPWTASLSTLSFGIGFGGHAR